MQKQFVVVITPAEAAGVQKFEEEGKTQFTIKDVEKLLNVTRATVQVLPDTNQLPFFRIGSSIRIPIAGYKKYIGKAMERGFR